VRDRGRELTYAELEARASSLAGVLRELGVAKGDRVGLYLDKQAYALTAIYGVLKAGAAYVPLDPGAPPAYLGSIAGDCGIRVLVTGIEKASAWEALRSNGAPLEAIVVLSDEPAVASLAAPAGVTLATLADIDAQAPAAGAPRISADDIAYILYTSGSTGSPKGVMLSHRAALTFVDWAVARFRVSVEDRLSSHAPLHFDLSIFDVFAASHAGAALVLVPPVDAMFPRLVARFIADSEITVWYSVPTALSALVTRGGLAQGAFPKLRTILFAGEVFPTRYLRQLMELLPHAGFYNLYGPTETNVCTYYEVTSPPASDTETIPIGTAISNVDVYALTEEGAVAGYGDSGELFVRGPTVMQGYWGDPEQTRRVLVPDPLGSSRMAYRTGDLVRRTEDGSFLFLGRRDTQIKSRGYRIELGEIETALHAHPSVVECAVIAVPDDLVTNRIKAAVVTSDSVTDTELARFCAEKLPAYKVPETFQVFDALPRTSTGKTDRATLSRQLG
jgi:L-proline---[L-prolyl-carrier protein] ligase